MATRRKFLLAASIVAGGSIVGRPILAQAVRIEESDPQAKALGYVHSAAKVDQAKYPKFAAGQNCANCALYQAAGSDGWGGCAIFGNKQVNARGWCGAWVKKA